MSVIEIFNELFRESHRTVIRGGADEPLYVPAAAPDSFNVIYYRADFVASALHEIAHWCIAGKERLRLRDYGYWYEPDGRDAENQKKFEAVEAKPQALEWHLSVAAGLPFAVSLDNLTAAPDTTDSFRAAVRREALRYNAQGLPPRAAQLREAFWRLFHSREQYRKYWDEVGAKELLPV